MAEGKGGPDDLIDGINNGSESLGGDGVDDFTKKSSKKKFEEVGSFNKLKDTHDNTGNDEGHDRGK